MFGIVRFVKPTHRSRILLTVLAAASFANGSVQARSSAFCFTDVSYAAVLPYIPLPYIPANLDREVVLEVTVENVEAYTIIHYRSDKILNKERIILKINKILSGNINEETITINQIIEDCWRLYQPVKYIIPGPLRTGQRGFIIGTSIAKTDQNITFVPRPLPYMEEASMDTHK